MHQYAPTRQLTASEEIWGGYYTKTVGHVVDGSWKPDNVWGGIKDGMIDIAPLNDAIIHVWSDNLSACSVRHPASAGWCLDEPHARAVAVSVAASVAGGAAWKIFHHTAGARWFFLGGLAIGLVLLLIR